MRPRHRVRPATLPVVNRQLQRLTEDVGTLPDAQFTETSFELAAGDCLFLYTDGIVEAGAPGEMFGDDRLITALESADSSSASAVTDQMLAALDAFVAPSDARRRADEGRDDLALLTVLVR